MYLKQQTVLKERLSAILRELGVDDGVLPTLVVEQPPESKFGEYALPLAFELARVRLMAPRKIAEEIVAKLEAEPLAGFASFEVAGAGYINARLDRASTVMQCALNLARQKVPIFASVEHTSINPNKAAHIGHLRNAILGDTWAKLLKVASATPDTVIVQNYIDNTGVQVADIVVGLVHLEKKTLPQIRSLFNQLTGAVAGAREQGLPISEIAKDIALPVDYYCWNLYARVSTWYLGIETDPFEADPQKIADRKQIRLDTLHAIEHGGNEAAEIAELVSTAVLRRHLETMLRLGIEYDFLPRESEILHLHFWNQAFEQMKAAKDEKGDSLLYFETEGKNQGCWVMKRSYLDKEIKLSKQARRKSPYDYKNPEERLESEEALIRESKDLDETKDGPDEDAKVIVRSNGTVTYVGKDIAYHLWKFRLLDDCEFGDELFLTYPDGKKCYRSVDNRAVDANGVPYGTGIPVHFKASGADYVYNVIDSRQSDAQANVREALRGMGYNQQANRLAHFTYEMVALTPRCATELGYAVAPEDQGRAYIEVSGRKGFGVKADDLIDKLVEATKSEVDGRHPELEDAERAEIAQKIAVGALRYFMLKYTRNSVIAFDFKDALSFEGETGPYLQYAVVRTRSIFRKAGTTAEQALADVAGVELGGMLDGEENEAIWAVWLRAGKTSLLLEQCIQTAEPAYLAKHAFQLAQDFSNFYRKHHILTEEDAAKKKLLLATAAVAQRELVRSLKWLGIDAPEVM